jgi:hypothetical protein
VLLTFGGSGAYQRKTYLVHSGMFPNLKTHIGDLDLPECDPWIGSVYVNWLYTKKLAIKGHSDGRLATLISLFHLGEKVQVINFTTLMISAVGWFFEHAAKGRVGSLADVDYVNILYEKTVPGSLLRRLMVETIATCSSRAWVESKANQLHMEFLADVAPAFQPGFDVTGQQSLWICQGHMYYGGASCRLTVPGLEAEGHDEKGHGLTASIKSLQPTVEDAMD